MIDQRNKKVSFFSAFADFFSGFVDFKGYTSIAGHWFPIGIIGILFLAIDGIFTYVFYFPFVAVKERLDAGGDIGVPREESIQALKDIALWGLLLLVVLVVFAIPITASFARRLRDIGFTSTSIILLIILFYTLNFFPIDIITIFYNIIFVFVIMSLKTNLLETDSDSDFIKIFFRSTN
ncbi:hypothetical protein [Gemella morbillorum]|uniref:hypothetical protein n=1 Tax=Gemella morbillorum TaxID=29391 RepID=UPI0028CFDFCF|nr:hypothetical protein [Gemella morbillorum]